jgi:hypothetical protein
MSASSTSTSESAEAGGGVRHLGLCHMCPGHVQHMCMVVHVNCAHRHMATYACLRIADAAL